MIKKTLAPIILLCAFSSAYAQSDNYAILIDAGSSGSRLHLFEYDTSTTVPTINDVFSEKISPGISSYANDAKSAGPAFKKLFDDVNAELVKRNVDPAKVTISVMATAGMRLLPQQQQDAIYDSITNYVKTNYAFQPDVIGTISGKMEALYGWLDVNYLSHSFEAKPYHTIGSLDMGGASTEIAYQTTDSTDVADETTLTINNHAYTVFSKSYLNLGMTESFTKMQADSRATSCFPTNYTLADKSMGLFNYSSCKALYKDMIDQFNISEQLPSIGEQPFVAYSGYFYVFKFLGADQDASAVFLEQKTLNICTQDWDKIAKQFPTEPAKYLSTYCANASYMSELLYAEYRLANNKLSVADKINNKELDWTLGALLYKLVQ